MTKKEKEVQKALGTFLLLRWTEGKKLRTAGRKLQVAGVDLCKDGDHLRTRNGRLSVAGKKLQTEGHEQCIKGNGLLAEGRKLYEDAVAEVHGPEAKINWSIGEVTLQ